MSENSLTPTKTFEHLFNLSLFVAFILVLIGAVNISDDPFWYYYLLFGITVLGGALVFKFMDTVIKKLYQIESKITDRDV